MAVVAVVDDIASYICFPDPKNHRKRHNTDYEQKLLSKKAQKAPS
jgi:hypothetical protein